MPSPPRSRCAVSGGARRRRSNVIKLEQPERRAARSRWRRDDRPAAHAEGQDLRGLHSAKAASGWAWQGRASRRASDQSPKIDLGGTPTEHASSTSTIDGLVDVVVNVRHRDSDLLSLGRYPGGDGQFGHATLDECHDRAALQRPGHHLCSLERHVRPLQRSGHQARRHERRRHHRHRARAPRRHPLLARPRQRLLGHGPARRLPGREVSARTATSPCRTARASRRSRATRCGSTTSTATGSTIWSGALQRSRCLAERRRRRLDRASHHGEHAASSDLANRVRLIDVNGSGTPDILWGDGDNYRYIDLAGGDQAVAA